MRESDFQRDLKKELKERFPGCYVLKNDPSGCQGVPDLTVLYKDKWAMLECKKDEKTCKSKNGKRPNQPRRIDELNNMSFARFIFPENKEEVLNEMERTFRS